MTVPGPWGGYITKARQYENAKEEVIVVSCFSPFVIS
jgi:hypothetical protein